MSISILGLGIIAGLLLIAGRLIFLASRKGRAADVVLSVSICASGALSFIGLKKLLVNDSRGLIITLAGVVMMLCVGIVYTKFLKK